VVQGCLTNYAVEVTRIVQLVIQILMTSSMLEYWAVSVVSDCKGMVIEYIAIPSLENNDLVSALLANY